MAPRPKKRKADASPSTEGNTCTREAKRTKPDVVIKVGGQTFHHYSQVLSIASDFFDVALNSGMKESHTKCFEFTDKDPEEWKLFSSFLEPFSEAKINKENVEILIPWFHEFGVPVLLAKCDNLYAASCPRSETKEDLKRLFHAASFSAKFSLTNSKEAALDSLSNVIETKPYLFLDADLLVLLRGEELQQKIWKTVCKLLPIEISSCDTPEKFLQNPLFASLLKRLMVEGELKRENNIVQTHLAESEETIKDLQEKIAALPRTLRSHMPTMYMSAVDQLVSDINQSFAEYGIKCSK